MFAEAQLEEARRHFIVLFVGGLSFNSHRRVLQSLNMPHQRSLPRIAIGRTVLAEGFPKALPDAEAHERIG